jgi:4'-phosphopantetheinyl transferase
MEQLLSTDPAITILGFSAQLGAKAIEGLATSLTKEERQRAARFRQLPDQAMFICSRSVLRRIISIQLGLSPTNVPIAIDEFGKPYLQVEDHQIEFSISHSSGMVFIAFAAGRKLGVDLERIGRGICQVDNAFFTQDELKILNLENQSCREEMFCKGWVLKEALLKAMGSGLLYPPSSVSISACLSRKAGVFCPVIDPRTGSRWLVQSLGGYQDVFAAAIACEEKGLNPVVNFTELDPLTLKPVAGR